MRNRDVRDKAEIAQLIAFGEYIEQELITLYRLKKYRAMKNKYYGD